MKGTERKGQPVLRIRFYREDGTVVEAEVPGPLVTMPAKRKGGK